MKINEKKLLKYGFEKNGENLIYKKNLKSGNFYAEIIVAENNFISKVYDAETNEEYLPFYSETFGSFSAQIKDEVKEIIEKIKKELFGKMESRNKIRIIEYAKEKYGTIPEYPWEKSPDYFTLKTKENDKWYLVFMIVKGKTLGLKKNDEVEIINLKNEAEKIAEIVDNRSIFPAYHMNKKYWMSVKIDEISFEEIKGLIDESYGEVIGKK